MEMKVDEQGDEALAIVLAGIGLNLTIILSELQRRQERKPRCRIRKWIQRRSEGDGKVYLKNFVSKTCLPTAIFPDGCGEFPASWSRAHLL